jgi:hypothetical protein
MSNPTTPFGWQMPTATDLVTDLPADFEVFGQAVATSMADLLGGTSGQVLAKNSNTDMDFVWVTSDDANAIQNAIVDAKGDLIAASAADTPARLAVGNNGETLMADSSTATGLRYQGSIAAGRNFVINGGMDVWQRGTSGFGTSTGTYTADRWVLGSSSTTVTQDTDVPVSPYFNYSLKMVGTGDNSIIQRVEALNSTLLAGQTVTFSFYAKRTAGAGALDVRFYYPTSKDVYGAITQIGSTVVVAASPSSSWTRYSVTAAIGTNITTGLQILINNTGASTTFITGAQLELGNVATSFSRVGGTVANEITACLRYFEAQTDSSGGIDGNVGMGFFVTTTTALVTMYYTKKLKSPSTTLNAGNLEAITAGAGITGLSSITFGTYGAPTTTSQTIAGTVSATTVGLGCQVRTASTAYSIWIDAEL